ncbi:hypothetical protein MKW94_007916 [Papaver nudicaule]|uniref:Two-component response regulator n=1 Tax=Papaver nudicaule TaxID=74823 RepID=A0AA41W1F6_PAPNU|nr:hypothetical protein [Papaver nudicaule]
MDKASSSNRGDAKFPAGLRVLVVDDDLTCLKVLERMLQICLYEVTTCSQAVVALSLLRERKYMFDVVLSDVHMPDMDGFKLLELIGLEMDLPVIMMSMDDKKEVVMKGVTHGACDYLTKPIRMEAIKNIWQHVIRKRRHELKELEQATSVEDNDRLQKPSDDVDNASSANEGSWKNKRKDEEDDTYDKDDNSTVKKPRVVWSIELHQQFVSAVNQLGIDKAVPKKILELMNVPGLTRENVASHLQKYRLYLKRVSGGIQSGFSPPFLGSANSSYGSLPSLDDFNLQTLNVRGQPPLQNLASLQVGITGPTGHGVLNMHIGDQRNLSGGEPARLRFGMGNQVNNNNQVSLLSGLQSSIGPKPSLINMHPSLRSFGNTGLQANGSSTLVSLLMVDLLRRANNSLMMQMPQSQLKGQLFSNDVSRQILRGDGIIINDRVALQNTLSPVSQVPEITGHGFPLGNSTGVSCQSLIETFRNGGSSGAKGLPEFNPSYDILADLRQLRAEGSYFRNVGLNCKISRSSGVAQASGDQSLSVLGQQGFLSNQSNGHGEEHQHQVSKTQLDEENFDAKDEYMPELDAENFNLSRNWSQDDLISALFKQQQDGVGMINTENNFDAYPLDNISV